MARRSPRHMLWVVANIFGRLTARPQLQPLHHALLLFAMHGLGYDNCWKDSYTGEEWFITHVLAKREPKVCVDVGANVGTYSRMLTAHTRAHVYAIEPSSAAHAILSRVPNITPIRTALADFEGTATLHAKTAGAVTASLDAHVSQGGTEQVPVTTLEALVRTHAIPPIDFLKIDVEGYEREVLTGMGSIRPQMIQFEFNKFHLYRRSTLFELCELLPGYTFYRLLPRGWVQIQPRKMHNNLFMFSNIVAVRQGA